MLGRLAHALANPLVIPRYLMQRRQLLRTLYRQRHNGGVFSVNITRDSGFFAQLTWCSYILAYCDARRLVPHLTSANPGYTDPARGPDCLAYFFANPHQARIDGQVVRPTTFNRIQDLGLPTWCIAQMTVKRANQLMQRYLPVRHEIIDEVDRFAAAHFDGGNVIGLHFRGTDKSSEAPPVPRERCVTVLRRILADHPEATGLFVASDVASFVEYVRAEIRTLPVFFCDDFRSEGRTPVHRATAPGGPYRKGREAMINCLLLARCALLVRTASTLSAWASVFNPPLPVIMLNQPYPTSLWFPDRDVVRRATIEPD